MVPSLLQYAPYAAQQIRAMHPDILGHPGAAAAWAQPRRLAGPRRNCNAGGGRQVVLRPLLRPLPWHPSLPLHPPGADPLVETVSLASVALPALSFTHALHDCVEHKLLSDAQLETVVRGGRGGHMGAHGTRRGCQAGR